MATNISYKSNQLASFTNATKTLKTAGKYVEGDIVVTNTTTINSLSVTPSELTQTFNANGVDGYKPVAVAAITSTYVGSGITTNPTVTMSGPSVTIPAGYYSSQQTKTVDNATVVENIHINQATPTITISQSGVITARVNNITTTGVTVIATDGYATTTNTKVTIIQDLNLTTLVMPTLQAQTITPTASTQTINSTRKYLLGDITVEPIPASYIIPTGTITITTNGTHNITSYVSANVNVQPNLTTTAITATSTTQIITPPSGCVGFSTVTVNAITLVTYYTGKIAPTTGFGNNGDIFLLTD